MLRFSAKALLFCCTLFSLASCRKEDPETSEIKVVNRLGESVTVDFYSSLDDYATGTNMVARQSISANQNMVLPPAIFKDGQTYYIDWYNSTRYHTNWYNDKYKSGDNYVVFKPEKNNNSYYVEASFGSNKNYVFLDTMRSSTTWKAVDVYQYSPSTGYVSVWNSRPEAEKYRELTIRKDFTAAFLYKDENGTSHTEELEFKVHESKDAYIEFMDANGNGTGSVVAGELPTSTAPEYYSNSVDTVMAILPYSPYRYMMVKQ